MLAWTWRGWPDPLVDYGREVHAAWRIANGGTLYVDLVHFCGPLSVYLNALFFRVFGTSVLTIALCNAALTALFTVLLYGLLVRLASRFAATIACVVFMVTFAFGQFTRIADYNWLCPYSYELVHGTMCAVAGLWCLDRYHRTRRIAWIAGTGFALGLVVLTKAEPLLAAMAALPVGLVLTLLAERPPARRTLTILAAFGGAAAIAPASAFVWFASTMPVADVLRWPLGHWRTVAQPEFATSGFYRSGMGTDDVGSNLTKLGTTLVWWIALLGLAVGGAAAARRIRLTAVAMPAVLIAFAVPVWALVSDMGWYDSLRPLPLLVGGIAVASLASFVRHRDDVDRAFVLALRTSLAVFALALLAKIVLNVRFFQYGFVLAMPATMLLIVGIVHWLPAALDRRGLHGAVVRAAGLGVLVAAMAAQLGIMHMLFAAKTHVVGEGADAFYADERGLLVRDIVRDVRGRVAPTETLLGMPEGVMVNFLARRASPLPFYSYDGTSRLLWGSKLMRDLLEERAADYVLLLDRGNRGSRMPVIGQDYFKTWFAVVKRDYRPVARFGATPFESQRPGATLLRRDRDLAPPHPGS
jgi:hypothetical protein